VTAARTGTAPEGVVGALAAQRERSRAQVAQYHQIRAALEQLRVSASSSDRSVTVEMAAGGAIVDLRLTQQAMSKTPDTLASTILEAIRLGLAQVAEQTSARVEPLTGRRIDVSAIAQGRLPSLRGSDTEPGSESDGDRNDAPEPVATPAAAADLRFPPEEE
jgi:DNA-binding protein YbaB